MEYTKYQTYSFQIEPFNNQLALYYWQYGSGIMKAYIYRPLGTSHYQIAKDFVSIYPQYQIDFAFHNYMGNIYICLPLNSRFQFDSTHYVDKLFFDFNMNYLGIDLGYVESVGNSSILNVIGQDFVGIDLSSYGETYYNHLSSQYLYVPYQASTTFQLRVYKNILVLVIGFSGTYRYIIYSKIKKNTDCCLEALCNPNDYILI